MTRFRSLPITAVAVLAFSLGTTACDATKDARPTPSLATKTTAPASDGGGSDDGGTPTTVTAPNVPAPDPRDYPGMDEQTEEGAQQAYRYYWAQIIYGYQAGDIRSLESLDDPSCQYCSEVKRDISTRASNGGRWGQAIIVDRVLHTQEPTPEGFAIGYGFTLSAHSEKTSSDASDEHVGEITYGTVGVLVWRDNKWVVTSVDLAQ